MTEPASSAPTAPFALKPDDLQRLASVVVDAQQAALRFWTEAATKGATPAAGADPAAMMRAGAEFWMQGVKVWQDWLSAATPMSAALPEKDKRFRAPEWRQPPFDALARNYLVASEKLLAGAERMSGLEPASQERLLFALRAILDAVSPSNFPWTNPEVLKITAETGGANLLKGLENALHDLRAGQLTHTDREAFAVGRNLAMTPGKVIKETPLYQLIHYAPTTETVFEVPLVIFPPWINRFYILDLAPEKSFVKWAVDQGLSVFMVSWKSADESLRETTFDDYVVRGQIDAIDTVRDLLDVEAVHTIGYCVAGTTLAATLALLEARGEAEKVATATFFTAQVDFEHAGELKHFLGDDAMRGIAAMSKDTGTMDGRKMAAVFNALRGRDLIWGPAVDHYLLGKDYKAFDLLHWNGDTTNLPAAWHGDYLQNFYRGNKLAQPGGVSVDGTPIDLTRVRTPAYIQAGREDHIAPAQSVFKITHHFRGPTRFVLAGSGHIAGVVNHPSANKYGYALNEGSPATLDAFIEGATEHKGSWWPDWLAWLAPQSGEQVRAKGARKPGKGKLPAIEDAPGRYVQER
ncbi:MAG TPA: class I poly(R)-hydroxyalkanoic acid synthase [Sphingomonadaceae bacterium]|nr:class I poly(R)-hydroxyalkanoic acid synthase [Sphingomonadaceae bacterium]